MYSLAEKEEILDNHIKEILLRCRDTVNSDYPDAEIILYGSRAKGDSGPDSDVDLLVLLYGQVTEQQRREIHDMLYDIALDGELVISVIIKSNKQWNMPISQATPLYQNIQREGIKIA